ncbi:MAG: SH3 domain-containing protein, partial [Bacteroidota bacterium]
YESLYSEQGISSPATLLKMAYIKEGLGDYSNALFYLSAYFKQTLDEKALDKINELVEANELKGYTTDNNAYIQGAIAQYGKYILGGLLLLICAGLLLAVRQVSIGKSPALLAVMLVLLIPMPFVINYDFPKPTAIVMDDTTYLMDGPSGSANVMETVSKGHKVQLTSTNGLWVKVRWEEGEYYVRRSKIKEII